MLATTDFLGLSGNSFGWLQVLLDAALKGTVVLVAAAALTVLLRRLSAAHRHLVWLLALAALAALPAVSAVVPAWRLAVLPHWMTSAAPGETAPDASPPGPRPLAHNPAPMEDETVRDEGRLIDEPSAVMFPSTPVARAPVVDAEAIAPASPDAASPAPPAAHWPAWILSAWLVGVLAVMAPLVAGSLHVRRMARRARLVSGGTWRHLLDRVAVQLGLGRHVRLLESDEAVMPLACGLWRPTVVLPRSARRWPAERLRIVLLHELAHVRRHDCLVQMLAHVVCALYWFNPLAWLAARMLRLEREQACDDLVLGSGSRASDYAGHLLQIVSSLRSPSCPALAAVAMARRSKLESRLRAILDRTRSRRALTRLAVALALAALVCVVVPLAALRLAAQDKTAETVDEKTPDEAPKPADSPELPPGVDAVVDAATGKTVLGDGSPFRFDCLAWMPDTGRDGQLMKAQGRYWRADGTPLPARHKLEPFRLREPWRGPERPHLLEMWFAYGDDDSLSLVAAAIEDPEGRPVEFPGGSGLGSGRGTAHIMCRVDPAATLPETVAVRLRWAEGEWQELGRTSAGFTRLLKFPGDIQVVRVREEKAFGGKVRTSIELTLSKKTYDRVQLTAVAIGTDGKEHSDCSIGTTSGDGLTQQEVGFLLKRDDIKEFVIRKRDTRTVLFRNVSLAPVSDPKRRVPSRQPPSAESLVAFGPVREQTLCDVAGRTASLLDFETGRVFDSPSAGLAYDDVGAFVAAHGIDAAVSIVRGKPWIEGFCIALQKAPDAQWDTLKPSELPVRLEAASKSTDNAYLDFPEHRRDEIPATYLMMTGDGGYGIVQLLALQEEPRPAVKIRYKMARTAEQAGHDAFSTYLETCEFLHEGGSREAVAAEFADVARRWPDSPYGRVAATLARDLEAMAQEDREFKRSKDPAALSEAERIRYLVHELRDVAEQSPFVPGKTLVLRFTQPDSPAVALRNVGIPAVPALLALLDDDRPTRSFSGAMNGAHVLRYSDVALQIIEGIFAREFDSRTQRGAYLASAEPELRAGIVAQVKAFWNENRDKTEAEMLRASLLAPQPRDSTGTGWLRYAGAERLIQLEGEAKAADFFRRCLKADGQAAWAVAMLWKAAGRDGLDAMRQATSSEHFEVRRAAYQVLLGAGEPGVVESIVEELGRSLDKRYNRRRLIELLAGSRRDVGVVAAANFLQNENPDVAHDVLWAMWSATLTPRQLRLVLPHMMATLDDLRLASDRVWTANWVIRAVGLPIQQAEGRDAQNDRRVVQEVLKWWKEHRNEYSGPDVSLRDGTAPAGGLDDRPAVAMKANDGGGVAPPEDAHAPGAARPAWVDLLPISPVTSITECRFLYYARTLAADAKDAGPVELEMRSADNRTRIGRVKDFLSLPEPGQVSSTRIGLGMNEQQGLGKLPDGEYLLAVNVGGVRCSNVARLKIDAKFDAKREPPLNLVPMGNRPGEKLPLVGLVATGPDPMDQGFKPTAFCFPALVVDGAERNLTAMNFIGGDQPLQPGERRQAILELSFYEPRIEPKPQHAVKAVVRSEGPQGVTIYESALVTVAAADPLAAAWDRATAALPEPVLSLHGKVVGPGGKPAEGYELSLSAGDRLFQERTDAEGGYRFTDVPPGEYVMGVHLPGSGTPGFRIEELTLEAGKPLARDFTFEPTFSISGTVTFADGRPAAGEGVDATFLSDDGRTEYCCGTSTDAKGRYTLGAPFATASYVGISGTGGGPQPQRNVKAGRNDVDFRLLRTPAGGASDNGAKRGGAAGGHPLANDGGDVAPAAGPRWPVWITLMPMSPVRSVAELTCSWHARALVDAELDVGAFDLEIRSAEGGRRVARVENILELPRDLADAKRFPGGTYGGAELDQRQRRRVGQLPDGEYLVAVTVGGLRCSNVSRITIDSKYDAKTEPTLRLVALPLGAGPPDQTLPYVGLVATGPDPLDPKLRNDTVAFPSLTADGVRRELEMIVWVGPVRPLEPGQRIQRIIDLGRYKPDIAPGRQHKIKAKVLNYESAEVTIPATDALGPAWDEATPKLAELPEPVPAVRGTVTGPDGAPAAKYEVVLTKPGFQFSERCDDDGHYAFVNIPPGVYALSPNPPAMGQPELRIAELAVEADKPLVQDFTFHEKFHLSGIVTNHDGSPAGGVGVWVEFKSDDGRITLNNSVQTDEAGRYTVGSPFKTARSVWINVRGGPNPRATGVEANRDDLNFTLPKPP